MKREARDLDNAMFRSYLLGRLDEEECSRVDDVLFSTDADLLSRLRSVQTQLIRDYAGGRLSAEDRRRLEGALLRTEDGRKELAQRRSEMRRRTTARALLAVAAMLVVTVGLAAWWFLRGRGSDSARPPMVAQPVPHVVVAQIPRFRLSPDTQTRGLEGSSRRVLTLPRDATQVDLIVPAPRAGHYTAEVVRRRVTIWSGSPITQEESVLTFRIPVRVLETGLHKVVLFSANSRELVEEYSFSVAAAEP